MGLRMMSTLVGWWIYNLTNAPIAIGIVGLSEFIPAVSLALYAGHVIDISEKRKLMLTGVGLYATAALLLLCLSFSYGKTHLNPHWIAAAIYLIIFGTGIVRSFTGPIFNVMLAQMVPKAKLQNAITWNTGAFLSASIIGHALGGFLIAGLGNSGHTGSGCSVGFPGFSNTDFFKKIQPLNERGEKKTWDSVKEGLSFVFKTKELLGAVSLDLFAVLFGGATALIPVYARDILKVGAQGFGFLNGASDMGSSLHRYPADGFSAQKKSGQKIAVGCCRIRYLHYHFWHIKSILVILRCITAQWCTGRYQCRNAGNHHAVKNT